MELAEGLAAKSASANGPYSAGKAHAGMKQVLALSHVRKSYGGNAVLDDVTLAFPPGAKVAGRLGDEAARPHRVTNRRLTR